MPILRKVLIIGMLLAVPQLALADNLIENPGFDNGLNSYSSIGYPFRVTNTEVHGSPYAVKNTISDVEDQEYYGQVYQIIEPVAAGDPVLMSGWIKTDFAAGSSARAGILVEFLNSGGDVISNIKTDMGGVNDWFKLYVSGHAPTGTVQIRAGAFIFAAEDDAQAINGAAYADDLFLDLEEAPGGIVTNPGFESQLSGWTTGAGTYPFSVSSSQVHSGSYSAYDAVNSVTGGDYYGFIYQETAATVGNTFYASAWGQTNISPLAGAKGGLIIQFLRSNDTIISQVTSEIGGQTDWRLLYTEGTAPSQTAKVRIGAFLWAAQNDSPALTGKFYVDDFIVSTSPISTPPPQTDLINAGFENGVNDWSANGFPFVATDQVVNSGNYAAARTIGNTDPQDYWGEVYQELPFSSGESAFVTAWVKSEINPVYTAVGGIQVGFYNSNNDLIGSPAKSEITANTDWKLLYVTKTAPAGTVKMRISGYTWAAQGQGIVNGTVYVDDVTFSNTPPSELILNPSFEDALSGWTLDASGFPMTVTSEASHSGDYAAKSVVQDPGGSADFWSRTSQEFVFGAGDTLYTTAWVKTDMDPSSGSSAGLLVEFVDAMDVEIATYTDTISGQTGWTKLYVAENAPTQTVKARVSVFASAPNADVGLGGTAYFDDVVASLDPIDPPGFATDLVNPGFELGLTGWSDLYGLPTVIDDTQAHAGTYSGQKTIGENPPNDDYFSIVYQDIYYNNQGTPFPSEQDVYLTAYLKSDIEPASEASVGIQIEFFDEENEAYIIGQDSLSGTNDWRELYVAATIPAGAVKVRVSGFAFVPEDDPLGENGTVNFDSFYYSYDAIEPPPLPTDLLNPGFENGLGDWDTPNKPAAITTADVYEGSYAAEFVVDSSVTTGNYYASAEQIVAVDAGSDVTVSIMAKTDISAFASSTSAGLGLIFLDDQGQEVSSQVDDTLQGVNGWSELSVSATAPAAAASIKVLCFIFADQIDNVDAIGATAIFDSAQMTTSSQEYYCGDINGDGSPTVDISDLTYLVSYMFSGGPAPDPMWVANVNGRDGLNPDISDLTYLVSYMFSGGPAPDCDGSGK